ncbi:bifunctional UDP-N-acetylglucosamine diphosphorylase/glucosamine-1-phosphate N-acetyltransferase GlmU [Christensenellaceae bacterium NSJ-44]|uniref:Bifunctional protein GlmU n=1 Tax=Luoshenia tenuis TaxID=2763654 RepID=A0A926D1W8_9FIRM|nr:bifunctional UDP-N-acetylglucosamine diphosphorylase/glucosamine-1-phosphate N-acetyltransferase GlmU [Luoshenia tenuis]MBC8529966.1 bifunctional UDP-N-acetylglucosamine diphosphorylase/glucosamine-1-phosphate N-acetyltransferase GlmU [Luoshenia tenuis]
MDVKTLIMAAGAGTRMKSELPKVLHKVCGRSLVEWVLCAAGEVSDEKPVAIIGHGAEQVRAHLEGRAQFAVQAERKGTGHAVMMARDYIADGKGYTLILAGDMPLIGGETLRALCQQTQDAGAAVTLLTAKLSDPTGYGRVLRDGEGNVKGIVEQKDATPEQLAVCEVNASVYCFETEKLLWALNRIDDNNAQHEYYLTDTIGLLVADGQKVAAYCTDDFTQCMGVNTRAQLAEAGEILRRRINHAWMVAGVTILDPNATYIDAQVRIGVDTVIYPGNILEGETVIGSGCTLLQNNRISGSRVGDGAQVQSSVLLDCAVGAHTQVGPFAYLRPKANVGQGCRVGDFVELKNANIGDGTKISHLTYVGDSDVGERVNLGCGVVFVNYDGQVKQRCTVGNDAFIGCNVNLVAPVKVEDGAYIAAGSTITEDVPGDALAIARCRQTVKAGWAAQKRQARKK